MRPMPILVHCWGDFACFTAPDFRAERVSYEVMTPSAARGILEAVYWHPGVTWHVQRIWVCKPIKFISFQRNELKTYMNSRVLADAVIKGKPFPVCNADDQHTIRSSTVLRDVEYYIQAYVDVDVQKCAHRVHDVEEIIVKRFAEGRCYHRPYFGCREFPADFELATSVPECPNELKGARDLDWMFCDYDYSKQKPTPIVYHPIMINGLIEVPELMTSKRAAL